MSKFRFEDLKVYQKALDFVGLVYETTKSFPKEELYGLTAQYKRAANSIALNIAEGAGDTNAQFNRYLIIARGSIKECIVCLTISKRQDFISENEHDKARNLLIEMSKMIASLQKYLQDKNTND